MQNYGNIVSPRPQVCAYNFAKILNWEESDTPELLGGSASSDSKSLAYIQSGGQYLQRVLARGREVAKYAAATQYVFETTFDPARANQAPPWPPAPQLVAAHASNRKRTETTYARSPCNTRGTAQKATRTHIRPRIANEVETFIGRDGTKWPMPPPECRGSTLIWRGTDRATFPHSPTPPLSDETSSTVRGSSALSASSVSTPASWDDGNPTSTSATSTFPELGRQWYASFGAEVGAVLPSDAVPHSPGHSARSLSLSEYSGERLSAAVYYGSRGNVVVGKDGALWPLPPDRHIPYTIT
ncbi:hypothetical protein C8Q78DRAFT_1006536 [Trametes maxima]|nr:hypothetical protein C8Q78DRAFT_1006536 [Trametes maxima]